MNSDMNKKITLSTCVHQLRNHLPGLARQFSISELSIFGSVARGDNRPSSDIDILVSFSKTPSLFTLVNLEQALKHLLHTRVDLVVADSLDDENKSRIFQDRVRI